MLKKEKIFTGPDDRFRVDLFCHKLLLAIADTHSPKLVFTQLSLQDRCRFCWQNLESLHVWGLGQKVCLTFSNLTRFGDSWARTRQFHPTQGLYLRPQNFFFRQLNRDLAAPSLSWAPGWKTAEWQESLDHHGFARLASRTIIYFSTEITTAEAFWQWICYLCERHELGCWVCVGGA